ncbi:MAG: NADH-quinone oxidoreductase subunit D [Parachlamydiaceae bacterium]|nr:NADH-quinone oxidoreductase subunit D [Parachlamydiaceae bacterium]
MSKEFRSLEEVEAAGEILELNLGPQHPSTHGVLRLKLKLDGEIVLAADPVIGYLHTGIEKECETRIYHQVFTLVDRLDYLSGPAEEQVFAGVVEKLMGIEVPERAQTLRLILLELSRMTSHLLWAGTSALELNMSSVFMYAMAEREKVLDLFEEISGARMFPSLWRIGGLGRDANEEFITGLKAFLKDFPATWKDLDNLLTNNYVWCHRLQGVGVIDKELCRQHMCTGPVLRAAGVSYDIRKAYPYLGYENYSFEVPTAEEGDSYGRYMVRMAEMRQSESIIHQALDKLKEGPVLTDDRKVALPPRPMLARSMEAVIHQFKLVSEGISPPPGELYNAVESARGELGCYLVSDGGNRPYRLRIRSPSFPHIGVLKEALVNTLISDVVVIIASVDPILGDVDR